MPKQFKLVVDSLCEIHNLLVPYLDSEFYDLANTDIVPGAVYLIGRKQFQDNVDLIRGLIESNSILPVLANPAEGSDTIRRQAESLGVTDLVTAGKIVILTGGDLPAELTNFCYEFFMTKPIEYNENLWAVEQYQTAWSVDRPYKFLFLNGRARSHRKYLIERLAHLLDQSLWSNLDSTLCGHRELHYWVNGKDQLLVPGQIKLLDPYYEVEHYRARMDMPSDGFVKYQLFDNQWGDIYINPRAYSDTYFSLVTETVFDYPYSFRTEKIWKPIFVGHPFVAVANQGYYRDLQNLGFRTFGKLIDESFDLIDNNQDRIERMACVVEDLCQQDLGAFVQAADETCKYNQQHLAQLQLKVRQEFPDRFFQFINEHYRYQFGPL